MSPDVAASVRARLLAKAHSANEEFERTLARFAAERWLFRLGESGARDRCVVKGAALLSVWLANPHRATRDIDLLAFGNSDDATIRHLIEEVCAVPCPEDGVVFDLSNLDFDHMRTDEAYPGVRARFSARLGSALIAVQVDFGFGDVLPTGPVEVEYPPLLDSLPAPRISAYPRESTVAEKFEAIVTLETRNTRMKDFHDIWALAGGFPFDGMTLREAVDACFRRRETPWTADTPIVLTAAFYGDSVMHSRWSGYRKSSAVLAKPPEQFSVIGERVMEFLGPVRESIVAGAELRAHWSPGGPWE